jgi:hypothetical protein
VLIEMCAWSLVTDASAGCSPGPAGSNLPLNDWICLSTIGDVHGDPNDRLGWDRHRQTHHWICAVDADGRALMSVKVANIEADLVAALATVSDLADQVVVWAVDIVGADLGLVGSSGRPGGFTPPGRW